MRRHLLAVVAIGVLLLAGCVSTEDSESQTSQDGAEMAQVVLTYLVPTLVRPLRRLWPTHHRMLAPWFTAGRLSMYRDSLRTGSCSFGGGGGGGGRGGADGFGAF